MTNRTATPRRLYFAVWYMVLPLILYPMVLAAVQDSTVSIFEPRQYLHPPRLSHFSFEEYVLAGVFAVAFFAGFATLFVKVRRAAFVALGTVLTLIFYPLATYLCKRYLNLVPSSWPTLHLVGPGYAMSIAAGCAATVLLFGFRACGCSTPWRRCGERSRGQPLANSPTLRPACHSSSTAGCSVSRSLQRQRSSDGLWRASAGRMRIASSSMRECAAKAMKRRHSWTSRGRANPSDNSWIMLFSVAILSKIVFSQKLYYWCEGLGRSAPDARRGAKMSTDRRKQPARKFVSPRCHGRLPTAAAGW